MVDPNKSLLRRTTFMSILPDHTGMRAHLVPGDIPYSIEVVWAGGMLHLTLPTADGAQAVVDAVNQAFEKDELPKVALAS